MEIQVKESTIIQPAQETPKHRLWLSSLDFTFGVVHSPTVYLYRPAPTNGSSSNFFEFSVLKQSLSKILVPFYPIAGRLGRDENGRLEIQCNAEGVVFMEAETSCVLDDLDDFTPSYKILQLVPTIDTSNDISSYPLLAIQVTHFKCGGACLGVLLHHTLVDGTSATHFINAWADITRGLSITTLPLIDRTILRDLISYPTFHHVEYDISPTLMIHCQSSPHHTSTAIIKVSRDQISILKAESMSKSKKDGTIIRYSTYEILAAHIWRCMCKARELSDDQESKLYIPISARSRLDPPLPTGYCGNVILYCTPIISSGDLQSKPFISTLERIRTSLKRMDDKYLKSAIGYIEQRSDQTDLRRITHLHSPNLLIVSWTQLPIHEADFGWGRPIYMGPGIVLNEGTVFILPTSKNDGSLELIVCLESHHMQLFKKYFYYDL